MTRSNHNFKCKLFAIVMGLFAIVSVSSHAFAQIVRVTVTDVRAIGGFDRNSQPDLYAVVKIDGAKFKSSTIRDAAHIRPNWRFERSVSRRSVRLKFAIREEDYRQIVFAGQDRTPSVLADINPRSSKRSVKYRVDTRDCILTDDRNREVPVYRMSPNGCVFRFTTRGNNFDKGAEASFMVTVTR